MSALRWEDFVDPLRLSPVQRRIMTILASAGAKLLSASQIADELYGFGDNIPEAPEKTIAIHIHQLRKKLEPSKLRINCKLGPGGGYSLEVLPRSHSEINEDEYRALLERSIREQPPRLYVSQPPIHRNRYNGKYTGDKESA